MKFFRILLCTLVTACASNSKPDNALVFQSDFGLKDGAVSAMKGVAFSVSPELKMYDITHEIAPFNILEGAYRLKQSAGYWPEGTVFVSVVDPGVGSERKSIVMKSGKGHYFVTPDNGTLTFIADLEGVEAVREIDERNNRLPGSGDSYTFHGRDVYAYTGARLAAGVISFEEVGPLLSTELIRLPEMPVVIDNNTIRGYIPVLDAQYGNVWTNIDRESLKSIDVNPGDTIIVEVSHGNQVVYHDMLLLTDTFAGVEEGSALAYFNSLLNLALAINQGNFAGQFGVSSGPSWKVAVSKSK